MDKDKLTIKDLQKGMKIRRFGRTHSVILIVDYVCVKPEHIIGTSYAVGIEECGIEECGNVYLITDEDELVLYEEEKKESKLRVVICSECGRQMDIKEWENKRNGRLMTPRWAGGNVSLL